MIDNLSAYKQQTQKVARFTRQKGALYKYVPTPDGLYLSYQHELSEADNIIFGAYTDIIAIYHDSIAMGAKLVKRYCGYDLKGCKENGDVS